MDRDQSRYGQPRPPIALVIMGLLIAVAMTVAGALWTFQWGAETKNSAGQSIGPIVAGLGVALGYVILRGLIRSRR
ncbi:hypothetical protein [Nocardioides sp. Kera G14]|uniref:hypothetical protein n=1 Tax=Nocardioides sp. Kera G14 TaxID=2884264 RepID=UPI001D12CF46|nr:hypothetical protein [Nocardioides sp. Kera G14]UDY25179.1 hypothetical protein LH076_07790 [Nocardioides sp. Kera G14]